MKKSLAGFFVLVLAILLMAAQARSELRFGFRFFGGLNSLNGGDLNTVAQGQVEKYDADYARHSGSSTGDGFKPVHLGLNFGGDFVLYLGSRIGIGFGSGLTSADKTLNSKYSRPDLDYEAEYTTEMRLSAIPLKVSLFYMLPLSPRIQAHFFGGAGYYLASMKFHTRLETPTGYFDDFDTFDVKGGGLGFHAGAGFEVVLTPRLSLVFDITGQYASFSNFKGKELRSGPWWTVAREGDVYLVDAPIIPLGLFPTFIMSQTTPSDPFVNVQRARVDFSGVCALLGLMIRL